jgi:hypothetical protein
MRTYTGTETVKGGYYLNTADWKLEVVAAPAGVLPGEGATRYTRVPTLAMLAVAPLMGMVFVILLPFIGLWVVAERTFRKLGPGLRVTRDETTVVPPLTKPAAGLRR